jgi:hypothetical protein
MLKIGSQCLLEGSFDTKRRNTEVTNEYIGYQKRWKRE